MYDAADLLDGDQLIYTLLQRDKANDETVERDLDVDSIDDTPYTTYRLSMEGQTGNGPGLWAAHLTLNLYVESGEGFDRASRWYRAVHDWSGFDGNGDPRGLVASVGAIEEVEDSSVFARIGPAVPMIGKFITHYVGSFDLILRSPLG